MVKLSTLFSILRWALVLTLIIVIVLTSTRMMFPKKFDPVNEALLRPRHNRHQNVIHLVATLAMCVYGIVCFCCYFYYASILFCLLTALALPTMVILQLGNIGNYLTMVGLILCSLAYVLAMRKLKREAMYGP